MAVAGNVRTKLGMLTRHAHLIDVTVAHGLVTLYGPIVIDEIDYLPKIIARVPGVQRVRSKLMVYKEDAEIDRSYKTPPGSPSLHNVAPAPPSGAEDGLEPAASPHPKTRRFIMAAGIAVLSAGIIVKVRTRSGIHVTSLRDKVKRFVSKHDGP